MDEHTENEKPRHGKKARYAARAALVIIVLALIFLLWGLFGGLDTGTVALPSLAFMIVGPALMWLMYWSFTKMMIRSCESGNEALSGQFKRIDTVIFDIGDVLAGYTYRDWFRASGLPGELVERVIRASAENPVWDEIDRGVLTYEEFVDAIVKNDPEIETQTREVFARSFHGLISFREYAIPWVKELKEAGYRVYYLSNFSERALLDCAEALQFLDLMDGGVFSYKEKVIKPEEAIYRVLLQRYGIDPGQAVFIDDREVNVRGAEALGIRGIVFHSQEQVKKDLAILGVSPSQIV